MPASSEPSQAQEQKIDQNGNRIEELERELKELRQSGEQWRAILEALPAAVYAVDGPGRIEFYNDALTSIAGYAPQPGHDQGWASLRLTMPDGSLLPPDQSPAALAIKENRTVMGGEILIERPDGTRVPVLLYAAPLRDGTGKAGAVSVMLDISESKGADAQHRVLLNELNHRVKNNLQMLYGLLKLAERETSSGADAKAVLADASQRISAMGAAQTALYRAESPSTVSARNFVDAVRTNAIQCLPEEASIEAEATGGELSNDIVMGLALIANELVLNAAKHGRDSEGNIRIRMSLSSVGGDNWTLRVEDDGPGFDLAPTRKRASGLGLVNGLLRQFRGKLTVEHGPGAHCIIDFRDQEHKTV